MRSVLNKPYYRSMDDISILQKIAKKYSLKMTGDPEPLHGGLMHKVYKVNREQKTVIIKLLNPSIMQRPDAMHNFALAEQQEQQLEETSIPILQVLSIHGRKMQEMDGMYFYVFDYFEGKSLKTDEITAFHCSQIGEALAKIHGIDQRNEKMKDRDRNIYVLLKETMPVIKACEYRRNKALNKLPPVMSICHNDMDSKNVLWDGKEYRIIDLECLSYNNPYCEMMELALNWSGFDIGLQDYSLLHTFLQSYESAGGKLPTDWEPIYDFCTDKTEWLAYNIKRVLGIDCLEEEKEIGRKEIEKTIQQIPFYHEHRREILAHFQYR